jgi:tetratricopeptide (TPR) repeat protein
VRPLHVDEEDEFRTRQRGRSWSGVWVALVVLLAGGFGIAQGWDRIASWFSEESVDDPVEPFLQAGQDALRLDHHEAYRNAASQFTKALAFDEHDARALSGLSRAHALIAQQRLFEATDLEARNDPAERAAASALREQAAEHVEQAREHAEAAIRHGTGDGDVEIVLSDALRLSRDYEMAESRLARGRTLERTPSAEASRVEALIAADRAGNLAAAKPVAERAVAQDPGLIRARLLLARAELASGNTEEARAQLRAVLDRVSDHPIALSMQNALTAESATALDTRPPAAASPPSTQAAPAAPAPSRPEATSTEEATPRGYDTLVREGEQRLENGDIRRARALFEQALRERAGAPEALTGLGFVMLAEGNPRGAIAQLERAVNRGSFDALIGLGDAFRRLNEREQALRAYQRYLEHSSNGPRASIARRQVERLSAELGANTETEQRAAGQPSETPSASQGDSSEGEGSDTSSGAP